MQRRAFLAVLGGGVGSLTGCVSPAMNTTRVSFDSESNTGIAEIVLEYGPEPCDATQDGPYIRQVGRDVTATGCLVGGDPNCETPVIARKSRSEDSLFFELDMQTVENLPDGCEMSLRTHPYQLTINFEEGFRELWDDLEIIVRELGDSDGPTEASLQLL